MTTSPDNATEAPREFQSVILTLDHTTSRNDEHVVQKFVASTQTLTGAMLALFGYYAEDHLLHSQATIEQFQQAALEQFPCFVYRTPENVQIVMDQATFNLVCFQNGSVLQASQAIADMAGQVLSDTEKKAGAAIPVTLFAFELGTVEVPEEAPQPKVRRKKA
jgi:hypothetical protein